MATKKPTLANETVFKDFPSKGTDTHVCKRTDGTKVVYFESVESVLVVEMHDLRAVMNHLQDLD